MFRLKVSWCYALAGVFAALAVSVVMGLLGLALGFGVADPLSANPLSGVGTTFGIWTVLTILVSLAVGGFVAGFYSGVRGCEHGLLVWAIVVLVGAVAGVAAFGAAAGAFGSAVRMVGSGSASAVSTVGGGLANVAGSAVDAIQDNVTLDIDPDDIAADVRSVLRDTEVETLQPEYLRQQMREARSDLRTAVNRISLDPDNYDQVIAAFLDRQQNRLEAIAQDVDRDAAVTALMNRRDLTRPEAEEMVDNALEMYARAMDRTREAIEEARQQVADARAYLADAADRARVAADNVVSAAAKSALFSAIVLLLGGALCCWAGTYGVRRYLRRYRV